MKKPLLRHSRATQQRGLTWPSVFGHYGKAIVGGVLILLFILAFAGARINSLYGTIHTDEGTEKPIPKEKKIFTVLMMGYGGPGHDGAYLTDTMMLTSVNIETRQATIVSIPRDIWVRIPTDNNEVFERKINSVYQTGLFKKNYPAVLDKYSGEQGAGDLVKDIVEQITGLTVDYYLAIDFDGFKKAVDTLGGVEVSIEKSFTDYEYPIDGMEADLCGIDPADLAAFEEKERVATESPELAYPCRYEQVQFNAGVQTLDAEQALKFVRSRHSADDGGDFNRAKRQQLFMDAVRSKVLHVSFIPKILPLMDDLEGSVRTDVPLSLMQKFLQEAPKSDSYIVTHLILTTDNYLMHDISDDGQYILVSNDPDGSWDTLHKDMKLYLRGMTPTPSRAPTLSPALRQKQ